MGAGFVDWHPYEHPLYGEIEIGGFRKDVGRVPPTFLIEEMVHRNALFAIRHAEAMPEVRDRVGRGQRRSGAACARSTCVLRNLRPIPTRTARAAAGAPGRWPIGSRSPARTSRCWPAACAATASGPSASSWPSASPRGSCCEDGVGGRGEVRVRWFVRGTGEATVRFQAEKARDVERTLRLD